jgi:hypothetical protein
MYDILSLINSTLLTADMILNFYPASSLETVIREPTLYKLLSFRVLNLITIFRSLGHLSKESGEVRGLCKLFVTSFFYGEGLLVPRPTPKLEDLPVLSVRNCLFSIFEANLHSRRPFLAMLWGQGPHLTWTATLVA